jgi:hypothetical protein
VRDLAVDALQVMGPRAADHDGVVHWGLVCNGLRRLRMHPSVYRGLAVLAEAPAARVVEAAPFGRDRQALVISRTILQKSRIRSVSTFK